MSDKIVLGVDIGGSHITSALVNVNNGTLVEGSHYRAKVDSQGSVEDIINAWCGVMLKSLQSDTHSGKVAIAMPGPFDYINGISYMKGMGKFDALYEQDIRTLILHAIGNSIHEIYFYNDAGCFLQGELACGPASAYKNVMGFTLGTGFGSAIGTEGLATDASYWQFPFMGGICEDFFSSKWLVSKYNIYSGNQVNNVKELIDTVQRADPLFQVFDEFGINLGIFLSKLYKNTPLDCVVLGGNIAKASSLFLPQLQNYMSARSISLPIFISEKGENAALIGAAYSR
ncbi:ROK family protein [Pedobacter lithocola]|uniref:ROK family protein n=1 Tax=Pedobacter lithocola TaxID=1908239 RepID=A0ABV8PAB7_9SPHI